MPPTRLLAADAYAATQAGITRSTLRQVLGLWQFVSWADLDGSWGAVAGQVLSAVSVGQFRAAAAADGYLDDVTAEQGLNAPAEGAVQASAFSGVAADGRTLAGLLGEPLITAKSLIGDGLGQAEVMRRAAAQLQLLTTTTLQDTGRAAAGAATTIRPRLDGHIRVLHPPSCARCVILAGRFYRWSTGFRRHPRCDCTMTPTTSGLAPDLTTDPQAYVASLPLADREQLLGKAAAQALDDGADLNQLVNARRQGLSTAGGVLTTTSGRTGLGVQRRLMPEGIYDLASDRGEAIRLLRRNGFIR